jgi:hypothetical protein
MSDPIVAPRAFDTPAPPAPLLVRLVIVANSAFDTPDPPAPLK